MTRTGNPFLDFLCFNFGVTAFSTGTFNGRPIDGIAVEFERLRSAKMFEDYQAKQEKIRSLIPLTDEQLEECLQNMDLLK